MYRLLLVTHKIEIHKLYSLYTDWEKLGFETPNILSDTEKAIQLLNNHHYDVVSWLLPVQEGKKMAAAISEHPEILGMETVRSAEMLQRQINNIRRELLSRDAARENDQKDDMIQLMQREFYLSLLRGEPYSKQQIIEKIEALHLSLNTNWPVATASFRLPQGDYFLAEVWKYGRDRLENALRNIFETPDKNANYILLMINPHHLRLLMIPNNEMTTENSYTHLLTHIDHCQNYLEQFFELTLNIKRVLSYDNIFKLGIDNYERYAH